MAEKFLQTRIQLKYDSYSNWIRSGYCSVVGGTSLNSTWSETSGNATTFDKWFVPKAGEPIFLAVPQNGAGLGNNETQPTILCKVGDGVTILKDLPYITAYAGDVYDWAKAQNWVFSEFFDGSTSASAIQQQNYAALISLIGGQIQDTNRYYQLVVDTGTSKWKLQYSDDRGANWSDQSTIGIVAGDGVSVSSSGLVNTISIDYSTSAPSMDGTASAGTSTKVARGDHKHPSDTSKVDKNMTIAGIDLQDNISTGEMQTALDIVNSDWSATSGKAQILNKPTKLSDFTDDSDSTHIKYASTAGTLSGLTASITELNYVDGATGSLQTQIDNKLDKAPDGTNNLIDSSNKVNTRYLPDFILGQLMYGGTYVSTNDAATITDNLKSKLGITDNTIKLVNSATDNTSASPKQYGYKTLEGVYFIANSSSSFASLDINIGDWIIANGSSWVKVDNTDAVTGVKGSAESTYRTGNINITPENIGVEAGAQVNQNAFSHFKVGSTTIDANNTTSILEIAAGTGITITADTSTRKITINSSDNSSDNLSVSNSSTGTINLDSEKSTTSINFAGTSTTGVVIVDGTGSSTSTKTEVKYTRLSSTSIKTEVDSLDIDKVYQKYSDVLVLNCGNASTIF